MNKLHGVATVTLGEIAGGDLDHFLDLISDRAFGVDSHRAVGIEYRITGHDDHNVTLAVSADIDELSES